MKGNIFEKAKRMNSIRQVVLTLLPNGKMFKDKYLSLNPTRHDTKLGSFIINLDTGQWNDFATNDKGGDVISLYAYVKGISQYEAALVLTNGENHFKHFSIQQTNPAKVAKIAKSPVDKIITKLWDESINPTNTLVEKYLLYRGYTGIIPPSIKHHTNLYHKPTQRFYPAMVGMISMWPNCNEIIGLHRTYLDKASANKGKIDNNKMILGSCAGGAVMLTAPGKTLILTEGIETALSVYFATDFPTWAALSTSGLINIKLPELYITSEVIIATDNDAAGINAANKLAVRLLKEGYKVRIASPNRFKTDFNDLLREENGNNTN
ncbi:DUF7146 domain-containing protein [Rickettsiales endosymbiont of Stachyamoeba lipophora]|uniref:DUF7146 domain-containing protein n=1 Tax=Rickettsiales endosymbiont of Stachyamoeba lipophora TaxID=2486578 RepID=UPI0013DE6DE2|nr:toprim domain-containing protein [Rickettsiales endosymbiont of Stachyamoeba lipophora]